MNAFSSVFTQICTFIVVCFSALTKLGQAADNLATVAEESSGSYMDQARIDRQIKLAELQAQRTIKQAALPAPVTTA